MNSKIWAKQNKYNTKIDRNMSQNHVMLSSIWLGNLTKQNHMQTVYTSASSAISAQKKRFHWNLSEIYQSHDVKQCFSPKKHINSTSNDINNNNTHTYNFLLSVSLFLTIQHSKLKYWTYLYINQNRKQNQNQNQTMLLTIL